MEVVVMRHRGVRCAMPVEQVQSVSREPEGEALVLWEGREEPAERGRHLGVRTAHGVRWISATDVQHGQVSERLSVPPLLYGPLGLPSFVTGLVAVDGELLWLADCSRIREEGGI